jgi:hypothetical protein
MGTTVTPEQDLVFADHYLRGRSLVEISKITGKAKSTIQRHLADMGFKGVRGSANFVNPLADAPSVEIDESGDADALPTNVEVPVWITDLHNMVDLVETLKADNEQLVNEVNSLRRQMSVIQAKHEQTIEHWIKLDEERNVATSDTQHGAVMRKVREMTGRA